MKIKQFKYNVINKSGREEPWSGVFNNTQEADKWCKKHGEFNEQKGHKLVRVAC